MLFTAFVSEIEEKNLITKGDSVVAAVSGGADSVCLLHLLYRLRPVMDLELLCAHVNHGLRAEAGEDADFVLSLCQKWEIPFLLHGEDVAEKAKKEKISVELAGREVRYRFLKSIPADVIATAHNKNDVAESILLHLVRGCGLDGLCGIPQKRKDGIVRPLLSFSREQIKAYLGEHDLPWREDVSNQDLRYTRNKIRHTIIPQLEEINPSFLEATERMSDILAEENAFLQKLAEKEEFLETEGDVRKLRIDALLEMPKALRRRAVRQVAESYAEISGILELATKKNGSLFPLSDGRVAEREYEYISLYYPKKERPSPVKLPKRGEVIFGDYRITIDEEGMALPIEDYIVRTRENGDIFAPEGMQGRKKVKDFFIDEKIPHRERDRVPIITCKGKIAAIANLRRDRNFLPKNKECIFINIQKINHV